MAGLASLFSSLVRGERDPQPAAGDGFEAQCESCQVERWWQLVSYVAERQLYECVGCGAQKVYTVR